MKGSQSFLKRHSSTILSCIGAVGTIATAALAVQATPKALKLIEDYKEYDDEVLPPIEVVKLCWKCYIPAAAVGLSTIVCILGANALNKKQQAAIMSAYAMLDNAYKDYKNKAKELYGEDSDSRIQEEIAKDKLNNVRISKSADAQLFFDMRRGEYFESTMELVVLDDGLECYIVDMDPIL